MNFLEDIFAQLKTMGATPVIQEIHPDRLETATGAQLLALVAQARDSIRRSGLKAGDRCALLGPNSIRWIALDLALMAEGIIVVPLYARQVASELVGMMKDCSPARLLCSGAVLRDSITSIWPETPPAVLFDDIFSRASDVAGSDASAPRPIADDDAATIIYTSGTSGEPKGVVLNARNVTFMIPRTNARLDELMALHAKQSRPDRIFHYGPMSLAASWIVMLTALSRNCTLMLSMDLKRLPDEMKVAAPDYFINVPILLERIRAKIEAQIAERGGFAASLFARAKAAYGREQHKTTKFGDGAWLRLADAIMFRKIRKMIGVNVKALICGSAPLAVETQMFFMMLGIPVLQVYGLTETTAICTLDDPQRPAPGYVGPAVPGVEMKIDENSEVQVRGPNIFPGYWNRPEATAQALRDGWFHTGDQGEMSRDANWRIVGRMKNLLVLNSGHKVPPEPIEEHLRALVPGVDHVMLVGNDRSFISAVFSGANGGLKTAELQSALDRTNSDLPHYRQIRAFCVSPEPFSVENGLLTTNGKLKRDAIFERLRPVIEDIYRKKSA